jgi:hypothetical protein
MHEMMQRLSVGSRHDRPQFDERLIVLARQEQTDEILAQRGALFVAGEQIVEGGTKLVDRLSGRCGRLALGSHPHCPLSHRRVGPAVQQLRSLTPDATQAQHNPCPNLTNHRLVGHLVISEEKGLG